MNILITCLTYNNRTGSEIYFFELSHALRDAGHHVTMAPLYSGTGSVVTSTHDDIKIVTHAEDIEIEYDLVIVSHAVVTHDIIKNVKCDKMINIIHSEVIPHYEKPYIDSRVTHYVAIRSPIQQHIKHHYNIDSHVIYNPFDFNIYNKNNCDKTDRIDEKIVLFPGTLNYLRIKPLLHLLKMSESQHFKVIHVGDLDGVDIPIHENLEHYAETDDMIPYYRQCDVVSGILLGRTSIEGLLSGKRVFQFDVDTRGNIVKNYWYKHDTSLDVFDRNNVANQLLEL